jgi:hypothetical protein
MQSLAYDPGKVELTPKDPFFRRKDPRIKLPGVG